MVASFEVGSLVALATFAVQVGSSCLSEVLRLDWANKQVVAGSMASAVVLEDRVKGRMGLRFL